MAFCWRADDDPTLNAGLVAAIFQRIWTCIIARKPYIFVIFQEGSGPPIPPLDPHMPLDKAYVIEIKKAGSEQPKHIWRIIVYSAVPL